MRKNNVSNNDLNVFIAESSWFNRMNKGGLDSFNNYSGDKERTKHDLIVYSKSRDSDNMCLSNFDFILESLGGESNNVVVNRFGHWGCGWIESIQINHKNKKLVKIAYQIKQELNNYPVLDESDYYERESDEINEDCEQNQDDAIKLVCDALGLDYLDADKELESLASRLNYAYAHWHNGYYGEKSTLYFNKHDSKESRNKSLIKALNEMSDNSADFKNKYLIQLCEKIRFWGIYE